MKETAHEVGGATRTQPRVGVGAGSGSTGAVDDDWLDDAEQMLASPKSPERPKQARGRRHLLCIVKPVVVM